MQTVKKVIYIILMIIISLLIYGTKVQAVTNVKVTADTLNMRKETSTDSDIVTLLSKGDICELVEETGDWYKIKYKTYTGYVKKEYVQKEEDSSTPTSNGPSNKDNEGEQTEGTSDSGTTSSTTEGKIITKTDVRLLPVINSSVIGTANKDTKVDLIITEINGWSYVQLSDIAGWIRTSSLSTSNTTSNNSDNQTGNNSNNGNNSNQTTYTEKTMYTNDDNINLRKEPNTSSSVIMVVDVNTKLTVIGESGDWYQVKTSKGNAYVAKRLLSDQKKATTSRSGEVRTTQTSTTNETKTSNEKTTSTSTTKTTSTSTTEKTTVTSQATTSSTNTEKGQQVVTYAKKFLGVPYVYGGASKSGFDCSGFTMYVYKNFGISMSHGAIAQSKLGKAVKYSKSSASSIKENLQPGDLVFFLEYKTMDEIGHCGIYIGEGKFIHASSGTGHCVKIDSLLPGQYYNKRFCAARRVL